MVRRDLAAVADKLESANNLTNGEETEDLSRNDTASSKLGRTDVFHLLDEVLRRLDDGAVLDGLDEVLVGGLESGHVGRAHLLVLENKLAELEANLGVVDDEGDLSLDKADDLARSSANLAQSASNTLCVTSNSRTSSRCDTR